MDHHPLFVPFKGSLQAFFAWQGIQDGLGTAFKFAAHKLDIQRVLAVQAFGNFFGADFSGFGFFANGFGGRLVQTGINRGIDPVFPLVLVGPAFEEVFQSGGVVHGFGPDFLVH